MNIYFLANKKLSSTKLKLSNSLKKFNCLQDANMDKILTNNRYFIFKNYDLDFIKKLKSNNNIVIYENLDNNWKLFPYNLESYLDSFKDCVKHIDLLICNNHHIKKLFEKKYKDLICKVVYHEYDSRYYSTNKITNDIIYLGLFNKCSLNNDIVNKFKINCLGQKLENNKLMVCIHIDYVLKDHIQYHIHTSTKLATSLYLNSVFICNRQPIYLELLGKNYPLYFNDNLSNLQEIIELAKEIINSKEKYKKYLEDMKGVKQKLSSENILKDYEKVLLSEKIEKDVKEELTAEIKDHNDSSTDVVEEEEKKLEN